MRHPIQLNQVVKHRLLQFMNFITRFARPSLLSTFRAAFSSNLWREREESAEKVFISQEQKKTLSRLLGKIEESEHSPGVKDLQFQRSLRQILKRYEITNEAFQAEVINLHRHR